VTGLQGPQGDVGAQGFQGDIGLQGPQGVAGVQGNIGAQGFQGDVGPQGFQGDAGAQGGQGIQGVQGPTGPQGYQGVQGATPSLLVPKVYFASPSAAPGGNGSLTAPFNTAQAALNALSAGDEAFLLPGVYNESLIWPDVENVVLRGSGAPITVINAPTGDTLRWAPLSGAFDRMAIYDVTLRNLNNGGRCLVLDGTGTSIAFSGTLQAQFLRVSGYFENLVLDKGTSTGDAAYLRATSVTDFVTAIGTVISTNQIAGWNGSVSLLNAGHVGFSHMTLGNATTGFTVVSYDDTVGVPIPYGGRQGVFVNNGSVVFGSVTLQSAVFFVLDKTSAITGDITATALAAFTGPAHSPIIGLLGTIGKPASAAQIRITLPAMSVKSVALVDLSGAMIYVSAAKPLYVDSAALGISRNKVTAKLAQVNIVFGGTTAGSIKCGPDTDLDLRGSIFPQAALQAVGNGAIDRSLYTASVSVPIGTVNISITPPLPPTSTVWYPGGAPYVVSYELATSAAYPGTSGKLASQFTATGTAAVNVTAIVQRQLTQ
jgi:hypothetical protein